MLHAPNDRLAFTDPRIHWPMLASEKLDGWRMFIYGGRLFTKSCGTFRNRNLAAYFAELANLSNVCDIVWDCEIYSPRLSLPALASILESRAADIPEHVNAHVFDALRLGEWFGNRALLFGRRVARYNQWLTDYRPAHAVAVAQVQVASPAEAEAFYQSVISRGGEGIMLRSPTGRYKHGRATPREGNLYKFKPAERWAAEAA